jgi:superkiller protein 3
VKLIATKVLWLVQAAEVRDSHSFYFFTDRSLPLRFLLRMSFVVPLAAAGAFTSLRRKTLVLLIAYAIGSAAAVVVFVMGTRYRMPIVPALTLFAGAGAAALVDAVRSRDLRQIATISAIMAFAIVISHLLTDRKTHDLSEEWAFTGASLVTEHRLEEAEEAYKRSLAFDKNFAFAWDGLGLTYYNEQRWSDARLAFDRAAALEPVSSRTSFHLGLVDERERQFQSAVIHYKEALRIDGTNLDAARHLAMVLVQLHRDEEAIPVLTDVIEHDGNDAVAHRELAGALGATGHLPEAKRELVTAVNIAPSDGEAWLDLCLISLDLGATDEAATALEKARAMGAAPQRLELAAHALRERVAK